MSSRSAFRAAIRSERPTPSRANPSASLRHRAAGASRRLASSVPSSKLLFASDDDDSVSGRVRVSVRLRPRNAEDLASDADFANCVELQPELKRLILRKNNWSSESYKFDEVFTESASQKRVYEAVAKPIVESVLDGYNGTVMAYGQTGTGKTFTMGRVGREDPSESGIMVRAVEDILAATTLTSDTVSVSYLQLYMESIEDLLAPTKSNISIVEDPKTGEVFLPGVEVVKIRDSRQFLQILEIGEANRHAANTKLNAESSRSHAILMIYIERSVKNVVTDISSLEDHRRPNLLGSSSIPTVLKSKLLIVDLAGSERINKSGSEGHTLEEAKFINLSLTSLGKCINALAENSSHIPTRDSKLTRLLSDSFGGSARTSLIVTIGPSARHHTETSSTIMFGQRAMKVVNMLKLKEQFDYESFCWKLQHQVDHLIAELERSEKLRDSDKQKMGKIMEDSQVSLFETTKSFNAKYELLEKENIQLKLEIKDLLVELNHEKEKNDLLLEENTRLELNMTQNQELQLENSTYQKVLAETTQMYEKKISELMERIEYEKGQCEIAKEELVLNRIMIDEQRSLQLQNQKERKQLEVKCEELCSLHEEALTEVQYLKEEKEEILSEKAMLYEEIHTLTEELSNEEKLRKALEDEVFKLQRIVSDFNNGHEAKTRDTKDENDKVASGFESPKISQKNNHPQLSSGQNGRVPKCFEEVGLQKLLASLKSKDEGVKIHAVKVIANLAAEDLNQEKIVQEGGLDALLSLLGSSQNLTIYRVASGAIANLAMNEINQGLIVSKGGVQLLANIASNTADPQILRMVAGAIANLCGNERLHSTLIEDGGTKALSNMLRCQHAEVIAQVARGLANFAKCESRGISQGRRKGRSVLIEDGALGWLLANSATDSHSIRRHIELALCHLAQNEDNAQDFVATGAVKQLVRISRESSKEDIRDLAKKTLNRNSIFLAEIQRDWQNF